LKFSAQQRAIVCVLLLRGPQTPGELRTRTTRLADFADVREVETALEQLQNLNGQILVKKLEREPGKRESRYVHLFSDMDESYVVESSATQTEAAPSESTSSASVPSVSNNQLAQRVTELEEKIASLTEQVACLTELLED
jgi:uncharacterized protein YceH (UPF0502 family)